MIIIVANATSHGFSKGRLKAFTSLLELHQREYKILYSNFAGHIRELVSETIKSIPEIQTVVVCGGDGTINEAASALSGTSIPLCIFPMGTANVLAQEIQQKKTPQAVFETLTSGKRISIHTGIARFPATGREKLFLLMAGVGFDAAVCKSVSTTLKHKIGKGAYVFESMMQYISLPSQEFFDVQTEQSAATSRFLIVSCSKHYGGNFTFTPDTSLTDTNFQCAFNNSTNRRSFGTSLVKMALTGKTDSNWSLINTPKVQVLRAGIPVQLDGDYCDLSPVEFERKPENLSLLIPA